MSAGESLRPELVSAVLRGAGIKGQQLDLATQILPVMVVEDLSRGPFPPSRIWSAGVSWPAVAANISWVGVTNTDPAGTYSSVTIDYILVRLSVSTDVVISVTRQLTAALTAGGNADDNSNERELTPTHNPKIGNVLYGAFTNPVALNGTTVPYTGTSVARIDGPWTIGPQGALVIMPNSVNIGIFAFFKGRYHAGA